MITWPELTEAEPKLLDLEAEVLVEAERAERDPMWSFSGYWSYVLRPAIRPLVGWGRITDPRPEFRTEEAWHVAMSHLIDLLPAGEGMWAS